MIIKQHDLLTHEAQHMKAHCFQTRSQVSTTKINNIFRMRPTIYKLLLSPRPFKKNVTEK